MKYEDKKNLIIIFIAIILLAGISIWRFKEFKDAMVQVKPFEIEMPKIELPQLNEHGLEGFGLDEPKKPLTIEEIKQNYEIFISPNRLIQIKYPTHWQEIDSVFLEKIKQEMGEYKLAKGELLFFAHQKRLIEYPPILTIISMSPKMGLEQVIEQTKKIAEKQQMELEIIKKETKKNKAYSEEDKSSSLPFADAQVFEVKYIKENQDLFLKGKIVFTEKRNYLITILIPAELREQITPEIDFIFNSIEVIVQ